MEVAAGRGGPISASSPQPSRKEWRAITDHSFQPNGNEEAEHVILGQSEERTIYEEGSGPPEVDFCSIIINGGRLSDNMLQQRIHDVSRQREELQQMEIELKAQAIARSEIIEMQSSFELQIKEHADSAARLKEQLQERDHHIHELELKLEEKDRELSAVKMDNEVAWAEEEASLRRERDNSESERAQHLQQIHDLQEDIRDKESKFLELQDQYRAAQDNIVFKDEQLREAQAWMTRVQEMGAMQTTTNQTLQAELQERTEQFNQYLVGFQRQFVEMERHHLQFIQQLQLELAEARKRNGVYSESSQGAHGKSGDRSTQGNKENQINLNASGTLNGSSRYAANGNADGASSYVESISASIKAEHVPGVPFAPSSILRMSGFLSHGQMASLQSYIIQPQAVQQPISSLSSAMLHSHVGQSLSDSAIPAHQHWQHEQAVSDVAVLSLDNNNKISQVEQNVLRSEAHYGYEVPIKRHATNTDSVSNSIDKQISDPVLNEGGEEVQGTGKGYKVLQEPNDKLVSGSQLHVTLGSDPSVQKIEIKMQNEKSTPPNNQPQEQSLAYGQQWSGSDGAISAFEMNSINSDNSSDYSANITRSGDIPVSAAHTSSTVISGKMEPNLLDERSLLACIVRAIPAGAGNGIRINTTLTNRLAKMLAPLCWPDYKKHYGELDDFIGHHPELFVVNGEFIRLRDGAHQIISATTAVAKVAAAASSAPYSSVLPSVAVTPAAQIGRHRKAPAGDSRSRNSFHFAQSSATIPVDLSSKPSNEMRPSQSSVSFAVGNSGKLERPMPISSGGKDISNGRQGFGGRR